MEQLNRFRFRHRPLDYLAALEMLWEQTSGTGVLPHSFKSPREAENFYMALPCQSRQLL
jgi:hypothetical protein